ncbi:MULTISPECIES: hypothetical protein [Fischerella]|uniref:Uncharacterized protein n=1 Tax=Fischerella muscicola CCMEE 5323 TaxID=2019572 RepID=A0A2N6K470_FISMU|nr:MULTISPECIES: hypothetical protein [Fischerella]MBD2435166.1 hypothetical protein [Fischerella sp. FACHB-380]PLZ90732.1 hypothetical protein CEN44_10170 [Fischerella muscicola CCMEE 5323]
MKLLNFLKPKPAQPTIESYGQTMSGVEQEQIQSVMEWLVASLFAVGYFGKSHIVWYNSDNPKLNLEPVMKKAMRRSKPVFLYCCGGRVQPPPNGYKSANDG